MKKQLIIFGLSALLFTSCDPLKAEGDFDPVNVTAESLLQGATFAQFNAVTNDDGTVSYVSAADGNYIQYDFPNVPAVNIYYLKNGEQKTLSYGRSGGMFYYMPSRGSEPQQTLYFSYTDTDGNEVVASKEFTLQVAQALDPAVKVLVSNSGVKKWKWMPTSVNGGAVWGNGGYLAGEQDGSDNINGAWWGCGVEDGDCGDKFSGQTQHAGGKYDEYKGGTYALSYMEFNEDGSITSFSPEGATVSSGSFSIKDYNNNAVTNADLYSRGTLETSEGAILWPFAINQDGAMPTSFEIGYLDAGRMVLIVPDPGSGAWGECSWWSFMSDSDADGIMASHDWHWKATEVNGGAVWGNAGYMAGSQDGTGAINGAWWGCGTEDGPCGDKFSSQLNHAGDDSSYLADCYNASKMVFNEDESTITVFGQDGNQIRQGSYSFDMTPNAETYSIGTLNTSAGAILWPFAINQGGAMPTSFEIGYLGSDALILIVPDPGSGAWGECSWWSFGK